MQTNFNDKLHLAIIMDGNGRWATARRLPRSRGHEAGTRAVQRVVEAAAEQQIGILTLYAFSSDNWRRPPAEVNALMTLLGRYLRSELDRLLSSGVRLTVIGRRDRLPDQLATAIEAAEHASAGGTRMQLRIAIDYSSRDAILAAAAEGELTREAISARLGAPDVDLLIRTGGEQRLSDFLLWECAYAELHFSPVMWPEFTAEHLRAALLAFAGRERRFGGLLNSAA